MKQYPRIARLSTVGLRHHQGFDYDFHPFRTDFVGESGCGKSMIADLLQLILVGSEYFNSATDAMGGPRHPDGMVLRTEDRRGTDMGYAFLTIQLSADQFIAIGTYIDTISRNTTALVIQQGYDEEPISPLNRKLSFQHLLREDKILALDELKLHLEQQGMVCHSWTHKKGYYRFLYRNKILSLDLSIGDKLIKDYAIIIQSFSRGKTIDTQKGDSLKQFLFGPEAGKVFLSRFQDAVKELRAAFAEYGQNLLEIDLITRKQKALAKLLIQEEEMNTYRQEWLYSWSMYSIQEEARAREEVLSTLKETETAYRSLQTLKKLILQENGSTQTDLGRAREWEQQCKNALNQIAPKYEKVKTIRNLLKKYSVEPQDLLRIYEERKWLAQHRLILKTMIQQLQSKGIKGWEVLIQDKDKPALIAFLDQSKDTLSLQLQEKKSFRQFADINNKGSLGYWALEQKRAFTLEEESILMQYKNLSTRKPTPKAEVRYLLDPAIFLDKKSIVDPDDHGFWLYWNGLREYFPYVEKPIFTPENIAQIEKFFAEWTKQLEEEIGTLEHRLNQTNRFRQFIIVERNFDAFLEAYPRRTELEAYQPGELDELSPEDFQQHLEAYKQAGIIEKEFEDADNQRSQSTRETQQLDFYLNRLDDFKRELEGLTVTPAWLPIANEVRNILPLGAFQLLDDDTSFLRYLTDTLNKKTDKSSYINDQLREYQRRLQTNNLRMQAAHWKQTRENKDEALEAYRQEFQREPPAPEHTEEFKNGDQEKARFEQSAKVFRSNYRDTVSEFLPNDGYKFDNVYDCVELGHTMLPAAFQEKVESGDIIETIEHYLKRINNTQQELNKRKLQKIRDLLEEVGDEVTNRLTMARKIDNFLRDKEITGGHRVRLKAEFSKDYPRAWIDQFQRRLDTDAHALISEEVAKGISLEEKIVAAFRTCAPEAIGNPKIDKLLDPNAYLDVGYSMESAKGQVNKGSTGQSYAGIALLCIARLSIIGTRDDRKNPPGIRFMPIDEAEGLGSNYDMLYDIAKEYDYQIISLSINPLGKFQDGQQYIYMLQKNMDREEDVNYQPYAIFCEEDKENYNQQMIPIDYE